ncbi:MAG: hypothetical protein ABFS43_14820 [Thermodesulfobacteriota bacterium]
MTQDVYRELLEVMKKRRGGYAGMDIPEFFIMAKVLFTLEEAAVNNAMPRGPFTAAGLADEMGRDVAELETILEAMADKGLCMALKVEGAPYYQSARFMPGIFEFQFMSGGTTERDKQIAKVIHDYEKAFDAKIGSTDSSFSPYRVITVDKTIEVGNQVHTYDQVQTFIDKYDTISVSTCYCRHAASLRGEDTHGMPNDVCMQFGMGAQYAADRLGARMVTKEEAINVLDQAEEAGLIHMSQNVTEDIGFL